MDVSTNCRTELLQRLTKSLRNVALEPDTAIATIVRHLLLADALTSHPDDSEAASNATRAWFDGLKSLLDSKNVSDFQPNVLASIYLTPPPHPFSHKIHVPTHANIELHPNCIPTTDACTPFPYVVSSLLITYQSFPSAIRCYQNAAQNMNTGTYTGSSPNQGCQAARPVSRAVQQAAFRDSVPGLGNHSGQSAEGRTCSHSPV